MACSDVELVYIYMNQYNFLNISYRITTGFFAENTIVLAEGEMRLDGIFEVCVGSPRACNAVVQLL